jgi:hypothetical protein
MACKFLLQLESVGWCWKRIQGHGQVMNKTSDTQTQLRLFEVLQESTASPPESALWHASLLPVEASGLTWHIPESALWHASLLPVSLQLLLNHLLTKSHAPLPLLNLEIRSYLGLCLARSSMAQPVTVRSRVWRCDDLHRVTVLVRGGSGSGFRCWVFLGIRALGLRFEYDCIAILGLWG